MNAILDFARFLCSGCFVGDLVFFLGGFAVVVCVRGVCRGFSEGGGGGGLPGGFCPGRFGLEVFVRGGFVLGGFIRVVLSGGFFFCPGGFVRGVLSGFFFWGFCPGVCPGGLVRGVLSGGGVVHLGSTGGGVVHRGGGGLGFHRGIVRVVLSGWFCPGGFVRGGFVLESLERTVVL